MTINYKIAIPSYKRANTLLTKTLRVLQSYKIDPKKIHIFVANQDEKDEYEKVIPKSAYAKIIIGKAGIKNIRNFMANYFKEDEPIFYIDDDIYGIYECINPKMNAGKPYHKRNNILRKLPDLKALLDKGFAMAKEKKLNNWGIYPVYNPYFMKPTHPTKIEFYTTTGLRYIEGGFTGVFNKKKNEIRTLDDKEDYERSIKYYLADGGVLRFNNITVETKCYKEKGGMQVKRTKKRIRKSAETLVKRYPDLCSLNLSKKSGFAEVRLHDKQTRKTKK